ncbi:TetR/AcrR family transcriptional regulator [Actinomadura rupiterrae]|uniref:TetR/AcrR family transcriptional regulator n=1 Tax=Actinomadura rupiterrae TaxID=559627 RepID=UPI0020A4C05C|nr:TetR/AcrR family transcriptional regulator [Actinomadura rupiterrae]MCP2343022.1 AcrR family transcriptional regulator [Actinomadura rupiterrae]
MSTEGRTSLTERRRAETQMEIALAAAGLYAGSEGADVTAEAIARRAGVGLRTFYRYFRTKEDAIAPLLAHGAERWLRLLSETAREMPLRDALVEAAAQALAATDEEGRESFAWTRGLLRAAASDPALRAVWLRVNHDTEERLVPVLADLTGRPADLDVRLAAAAASAAIRVAVETWALGDAPAEGPGSPADLGVRAMRGLTAQLDALG